MSTIVHGILCFKSKDGISLKPGKKLNNLKRQYGIPQLCNDYNILAITVYIGEKTSSCTRTGALAIPDYASRQLNFSCFMFWVTRRMLFSFFVTWNFRDPFSRWVHNTYILVLFQSHNKKKKFLVDITFGLTDLSFKLTHGIGQLHFQKKRRCHKQSSCAANWIHLSNRTGLSICVKIVEAKRKEKQSLWYFTVAKYQLNSMFTQVASGITSQNSTINIHGSKKSDKTLWRFANVCNF